MSSNAVPPPHTVHVVGITGCSAAGKSTFAGDLASALHSPLYPISLDHFFIARSCDELETFEDCRTLDLDAFATALTELIAIIRAHPPLKWADQVAQRVPALLSYFRHDTPAGEVGEIGTPEASAPLPSHASTHDADSGISSADASLCAHEAEDLARRSAHPLVKGHVDAGSVVYLICEGFLLFAQLDLVESLFDALLEVTCDTESACWRRFHRLPRRAQQSRRTARHTTDTREMGVYEQRIRQLWRTRTEPRRHDLDADLTARLRASAARAASWHVATDDTLASAQRDCEVQVQQRLSPTRFFPPPLSASWTASDVARWADAFWEPSTGEPTDLFVQVMLEGTVDGERNIRAHPPTTLPGAVLSAEEWQDVRLALRPPAADARTAAGVSVTTAKYSFSFAERRYAEFRYWFFYEVLYYHGLYQPLQRHHVALCRRRRPEVLHSIIVNEQTTSRASLTATAEATAGWIVQHTSGAR